MDSNGSELRVLKANLPGSQVFPSWAVDADLIAYVSSVKTISNAQGDTLKNLTVKDIDVLGTVSGNWSYRDAENCGARSTTSENPSEQLYQQETGVSRYPPFLQWSASRHYALYTVECATQLVLQDTLHRKTTTLAEGDVYQAVVLAPTLATAVVQTATGTATDLVVYSLTSHSELFTVPAAEQPAWTLEGNSFYYVHRQAESPLTMQDAYGVRQYYETYQSAVFRIHADGSSETQDISYQNAYGFGPLQVLPDRSGLVFCSIDNPTNLWRHRQEDSFNDALLKRYGPERSIVLLTPDRHISRLVQDAFQPAV